MEARNTLEKEISSLERVQNLLPYRIFDAEKRVVYMTQSVMSMLELPMLTGVEESLIADLVMSLQSVLETEVLVRIFRITHTCLNEAVTFMADQYRNGNEFFERLADNQQNYYQQAVYKGLPTNSGTTPLMDSRLFCELSIASTSETRAQDAERCQRLMTQIQREFKTAGLPSLLIEAPELLSILRFILIGENEGKWDKTYDKHELLNQQITPLGTTFDIEDDRIIVKYEGRQRELVTFAVEKWPQQHYLSGSLNMLANVEKRLALSVPHMVALAFRLIPQEKAKARANTKYFQLKKVVGTKLQDWFPKIKDEFEEWNFIREGLLRDNARLTQNMFTITLLAPVAKREMAVSETIRLYSYLGLVLRQLPYVQMPLLIGSLPGVLSEGYWQSYQRLGLMKTLTLWNSINLSPMVSDWKGSIPSGFIAPGFHGQYATLDYFNLPADNKNVALAAGSGAGKSVLVQTMITHGLATRGQVFVIDKGGSYEKLCAVLGGSYIDATRLRLNPFVGLAKVSANQEADSDVKKMYFALVRDLIGVMVSPNGDLDDATRANLLIAVETAFAAKGANGKIDDVRNCLIEINETNLKAHSQHDNRLSDAITILQQYTTGGLYGEYFNSAGDLSDSDFIVLEMNALENNADLLKAVLFSLINTISQAMYLGPRARKKICVIDEAWALLAGDNKQAAKFIEQGFRTSRKHGGSFVTITQGITDYFQNAVATACWNASDIKIFMRQNNDALKRFVDEHPNFFSPAEFELLQRFQPAAEAGFSSILLKAGNIISAHRLFLTPEMRVLFSTKADEVERVAQLTAANMPMWEAVSQVAKEAGYVT